MAGKLKGLMAAATAVGLIAGALPAVVSTPGAARTAQHTISVNRTAKGDRLPLKRTSAELPVALRRTRRSDVTQRSAVSQILRARISLAAAFHEFVRLWGVFSNALDYDFDVI
jgi:hypothetical protein